MIAFVGSVNQSSTPLPVAAAVLGRYAPPSWPIHQFTAVGLIGREAVAGSAGRASHYTQGRRLENTLADSGVGRPRGSRSMSVTRRNSSRSWAGEDGLLVGLGDGHGMVPFTYR